MHLAEEYKTLKVRDSPDDKGSSGDIMDGHTARWPGTIGHTTISFIIFFTIIIVLGKCVQKIKKPKRAKTATGTKRQRNSFEHTSPNPAGQADFSVDVEPNDSVGPLLDIIAYSKEQWKGQTPNPVKYRKGYREMCDKHGFGHIRVIRGDNYCAVRSTIYQALVNVRQAVRNCIGDERTVRKRLDMFRSGQYGLQNWSFGKNLVHGNVYEKARDCITLFYKLMDTLNNSADPGRTLEDYFNKAPDNDPEIMEAVKVLMMFKFIDLHQQLERGEELPEILSTILFRNTSETPAAFFRNHLDKVGNEGGLEQIEMRLLSHTLGIEIRAYRMIQFRQSDFMTNYSETPGLPPVNIISEDDRHYNIVVP